MTERLDFKAFVSGALDLRKSLQQENAKAREIIIGALLAAHDERTPWTANVPEGEAADNVTKRLNVTCEDAFRVHLVIHDGGKVTFPKAEGGDGLCFQNGTEALQELAQRYALHRLPLEALVVQRKFASR